MATLKIFGGAKSRAIRSLWAIAEMGFAYQHVRIKLLLEMAKFDYSDLPNTRAWLDRCYARPALKVAENP